MLEKDKINLTKYLYVIFLALLVYLSYLMLKPFLSYILLSLLIVHLLYPLKNKLQKVIKRQTTVAILLTLFVLVVVVVPLVFLGNMLVNEILTLYQKVDVSSIQSYFTNLFNGDFDNYIGSFVKNVLDYFVTFSSNLFLTLPKLLLGVLVSLGVTYFAFKEGDLLVKKIRMVLPFKKDVKDKVIERFKSTMDAVVFGTIAMALVEGVIASFLYWLFGVPTPITWGLLTAIVSMLPFIGPAFVWLPVSVFLYMTGHVVAAFGLAIVALLGLTIALDMFAKNKIIAIKGKIHPMIVLLGVLGGVAVFGVVGFIIGPFVLSLLIFLIGIIFNNNETKS